jgi:hypothetical protein
VNLGQYGISYNDFTRMMRAFELPTSGVVADPFDPIRKFTDSWNANMVDTLVPSNIITVDESM